MPIFKTRALTHQMKFGTHNENASN